MTNEQMQMLRYLEKIRVVWQVANKMKMPIAEFSLGHMRLFTPEFMQYVDFNRNDDSYYMSTVQVNIKGVELLEAERERRKTIIISRIMWAIAALITAAGALAAYLSLR